MVSADLAVTLALDAATYEGSVAVLAGERVMAESTVAMRGETEERLMPAVLATLARAGVGVDGASRVVCGAGPGSFTSLRIAAAIAKGLAFGRRVPLFAVSSLALIVASPDDLAPGDYLAVLDAMRGERNVALFRRRPDGEVRAIGEPALVRAADVGAHAERLGATAIGPLEALIGRPHARGTVRMLHEVIAAGPADLDAWEPVYGRLAEAQVKWEAAHGRPLA